MENATKALIIVANLMLAVIVLVVIVYFFENMRRLPEEEDRAKVIEQTQKFNQEYEVYDKKLMYGVDVISALNKADSNNEKYVLGKFLSGGTDAEEFLIDVVVTIKTPLQDYLIVNYLEMQGENIRVVEKPYNMNEGIATINFQDIKDRYGYKFFIFPDEYKDIALKTSVNVTINAGTYNLLEGGNYTKDAVRAETQLKEFVKMSDYMRQTVKNTTNESKLSPDGWSSFEWRTALYDLKSRKFKCETASGENGIHYNPETGRIDRLEFVEI